MLETAEYEYYERDPPPRQNSENPEFSPCVSSLKRKTKKE